MALAPTPDHNCWRAVPADRFALIVDGAAYFRALRHALAQARDLAVLVGWDFDFELDMLPGESDDDGLAPDGLPNRVGAFLEALVERRPSLDIYLLKWSGGTLMAPGRTLPALRIKLLTPEQIHLAFDGHHPIGACHHQKIVVIDDALAFCGGIDVTAGRWDTPQHLADDPRRRLRSGEIGAPWHDLSAVLTGPAATALGELARQRWHRATGAPLRDSAPDADAGALWPPGVTPDFTGQTVAIARTLPPESDRPVVCEIEHQLLDAIASAREAIYIESQYFSAGSIARALAARLTEPDGPEIVVVNPDAAMGAIEDMAMHVPRCALLRQVAAADRHGRFRMVHPVNAAGQPIYVHAKLMIVDDHLLRVGSSNLDRRSMGFDTEADVAVLAEDPEARARVRAIRHERLAELLGVDPSTVAAAGGMIAAIESCPEPRLRPLTPRDPGRLALWLASSRLFDPRYRRSARARVGLTGRHALWAGAALLIGGGLVLRARRQARDAGAAQSD